MNKRLGGLILLLQKGEEPPSGLLRIIPSRVDPGTFTPRLPPGQ